MSRRDHLDAIGAYTLLAGFVTVLAWPAWGGIVAGAACLAAVLGIDLALVRRGRETVSQWLWSRFNRVQGWLVLVAAVAAGTARLWLAFGPFVGCLGGVLALYYIIGGHTHWDERDPEETAR